MATTITIEEYPARAVLRWDITGADCDTLVPVSLAGLTKAYWADGVFAVLDVGFTSHLGTAGPVIAAGDTSPVVGAVGGQYGIDMDQASKNRIVFDAPVYLEGSDLYIHCRPAASAPGNRVTGSVWLGKVR